MSDPILQLNNAANWEDVYNERTTARHISSTRYVPIEEITVPYLFERHIIAVYATSNSAKPTWYFAGFLNQRISLGLVAGGALNTDAIERRKIWLNRITLLIFPKYTPQYAVSFNVPKWFEDINLNIFEYKGIELDTTEELVKQLINAQ